MVLDKKTHMVQIERKSPNGAVFKTWWQCTNCGCVVSPVDIYCSTCGRKFTDGG